MATNPSTTPASTSSKRAPICSATCCAAGRSSAAARRKLQKGDAFDQLTLGDPVNTRAYSLYIYDETAGVPSLVASLTIDPNASWDDKAPKGFNYKDKAAAEAGVSKASLKTGAAGKTKVSVSAKGANNPMPAPLSMTEFFDVDTALKRSSSSTTRRRFAGRASSRRPRPTRRSASRRARREGCAALFVTTRRGRTCNDVVAATIARGTVAASRVPYAR